MRRIIALDVGTVRIGVAISDPLGFFAQGVTVLKTESDWMSELSKILEPHNNPLLLVGMPRRTDGSEGPEAVKMRGIGDSLKEYFPEIEIEYWDERFTTTIAQQALLEADVSRSNRKQKVDMIAATLLLQSYLDRKV